MFSFVKADSNRIRRTIRIHCMAALNAPILPAFSPIVAPAIAHSIDIHASTKDTHAPILAFRLPANAIDAPISLAFSPIDIITNDNSKAYSAVILANTARVNIPALVLNAPIRFALLDKIYM